MLPFLIGYTNWVSNIKNDLYKNGFGYVWETKMYETKRFFFSEKFRTKNERISSYKSGKFSKGKH